MARVRARLDPSLLGSEHSFPSLLRLGRWRLEVGGEEDSERRSANGGKYLPRRLSRRLKYRSQSASSRSLRARLGPEGGWKGKVPPCVASISNGSFGKLSVQGKERDISEVPSFSGRLSSSLFLKPTSFSFAFAALSEGSYTRPARPLPWMDMASGALYCTACEGGGGTGVPEESAGNS